MAVFKRVWQTKTGEAHCYVCDYFARDSVSGKLSSRDLPHERRGHCPMAGGAPEEQGRASQRQRT
jgi:hypothetical protein